MKKLLVIFLATVFLQACGNDTTTTTTENPVPSTPENVNGNIPDSNNSVNLNSQLPVDSSNVKDTTR